MMLTVVPNFKIPADYNRLFILTIGRDFKYVVCIDRDGIHAEQTGQTPAGKDSTVMDFITQSIETARHDCEK